MKIVAIKVLIALTSVVIAGALWMGLIYLLKKSGVNFLEVLAVWISQFSFIGWALFGAGSIGIYLLLTKLVMTRLN